MKRLIYPLLSVFLLLSLPSCNDDGVLDLVVFTGIDQRECFCCGGFMIDFSCNTEPYGGDFKLAYDLPPGSDITWESDFPVYAWINWEPVSSACDVIRVSWVRRY